MGRPEAWRWAFAFFSSLCKKTVEEVKSADFGGHLGRKPKTSDWPRTKQPIPPVLEHIAFLFSSSFSCANATSKNLISVHDGRPFPCWGRRPHMSASVPQHARRRSEGRRLGAVAERGLQRRRLTRGAERGLQRRRLRLCGGAMAQRWRLTPDGGARPPTTGAHAL
jgi:hypothetical protein